MSNIKNAEQYFLSLQEHLCRGFTALDGGKVFLKDTWNNAGIHGISQVLEAGNVFEKVGVNFSSVRGEALPSAATSNRPELTGASFTASGVSIVAHPKNPYAPTAHCNVRFFSTQKNNAPAVWWFGGGYDLTPYYPFRDDVVAWHRNALNVCQDFGEAVYPRFKQWCDEYFYIKHRNETRGVGGLFFDDLNEWGFDRCFDFIQRVGNSFFPVYSSIVKKRHATQYGQRERDFQQYRRGRYVEFNLVYDRGTLFGLQSGGRTESILMSLPPAASWHYQWTPEAGSAEEELYLHFLKPQDWLND